VLKNIPVCISPDLMYHLMAMGHGDEIVLADADFPAETFSQRLVRADGLDVPALLEAILPFFPLDQYVANPTAIMSAVDEEPAAWAEYRRIIKSHVSNFSDFEHIDCQAFYERADKAYVVVVTSEPDGNVILKKGVCM